jgi:hypothetical protein
VNGVSYPDLGCFAECLACELCEELPPSAPEPDLMPDWGAFDDLHPEDGGPFGDGLWAPEPERGGSLLDSYSLPGHDLFGSGLDLAPGVGADPRFELEGFTFGFHIGGRF